MGSRDAVLFPLCPPGTHGKGVGGELGQKNRQRPKRRRKHLMSVTLPLMEIQNCLLLLPPPPPAEGERGFGFLSSSRSEMGERTSPPVSPNQERPWEEEGREDTWMPRSNHLVVHLPTIYYYYIYVMLLGPSRLRPSLCLVSSRLSQTHTDTHYTTDTSPVLLLFFFFTA